MAGKPTDPRKGPMYVVFSSEDTDVLVRINDAGKECLDHEEVEAVRRAIDAVQKEAGDFAVRGDELGPTVEAALHYAGYLNVDVLYTGCMCHIYL